MSSRLAAATEARAEFQELLEHTPPHGMFPTPRRVSPGRRSPVTANYSHGIVATSTGSFTVSADTDANRTSFLPRQTTSVAAPPASNQPHSHLIPRNASVRAAASIRRRDAASAEEIAIIRQLPLLPYEPFEYVGSPRIRGPRRSLSTPPVSSQTQPSLPLLEPAGDDDRRVQVVKLVEVAVRRLRKREMARALSRWIAYADRQLRVRRLLQVAANVQLARAWRKWTTIVCTEPSVAQVSCVAKVPEQSAVEERLRAQLRSSQVAAATADARAKSLRAEAIAASQTARSLRQQLIDANVGGSTEGLAVLKAAIQSLDATSGICRSGLASLAFVQTPLSTLKWGPDWPKTAADVVARVEQQLGEQNRGAAIAAVARVAFRRLRHKGVARSMDRWVTYVDDICWLRSMLRKAAKHRLCRAWRSWLVLVDGAKSSSRGEGAEQFESKQAGTSETLALRAEVKKARAEAVHAISASQASDLAATTAQAALVDAYAAAKHQRKAYEALEVQLKAEQKARAVLATAAESMAQERDEARERVRFMERVVSKDQLLADSSRKGGQTGGCTNCGANNAS